ncbi:class I SAM-dependent methyltransferase [Halalkalibacter urbisdiaboli]|uniref:class I SAM-dependent methyltransferase n=1 Tax=Halalkalibacter urbisdiaboli TaxID=1960589 RepID=UPI000B430DE4|nr:class I SAM-dependent methyltransferase [Halalkalibacter urbisdiaboli]
MKVTKQDSWNAHLYDDKHMFVTKFGEYLFDVLEPKKGESILDVGCGTGDLAAKIAETGAEVVGIDYSTNMIQQAQQKYPHISFLVEDAASLPFVQQFDAVFSNAALHWMKQPEHVLQSIFQALKPGGRFVAEFGAKGNVRLIYEAVFEQFRNLGITFPATRFPWYFPSIGEYTSLMESVGFEVSFAQQFARPTPLQGEHGLRNWLTMFASSLFEGLDEEQKEEIIKAVELTLKPTMFVNEQWVADYRRLRVVATIPNQQ